MTQKQLADAIGASSTAISAWLSESASPKDAEKLPNAEYLFKMADFLQVSIDKLIGRSVPGAQLLEQDREELRRRADALDRILPDEFGEEPPAGARKLGNGRRKPARKKRKRKEP